MIHGPERAARIAGAEAKVLVVSRSVLTVEIDVKELAVPQRLGNPVREVQARHLLVTDLGVEPNHLRMLELVDEGQRVTDGRQQDVAARFIGLGLDGEPHAVSLLDDIRGENVEGFLVAVERGTDVFGSTGLGALAAAPEHNDSCAQLCREVEVVRHFAQRETADVAIVRGERAVTKDRVREQVGGDHRDDQPGTVRPRDASDRWLRACPRLTRRTERHRCRESSHRTRPTPPAWPPQLRDQAALVPRVPKTSTPCHPTVQSPKEKRSALVACSTASSSLARQQPRIVQSCPERSQLAWADPNYTVN